MPDSQGTDTQTTPDIGRSSPHRPYTLALLVTAVLICLGAGIKYVAETETAHLLDITAEVRQQRSLGQRMIILIHGLARGDGEAAARARQDLQNTIADMEASHQRLLALSGRRIGVGVPVLTGYRLPPGGDPGVEQYLQALIDAATAFTRAEGLPTGAERRAAIVAAEEAALRLSERFDAVTSDHELDGRHAVATLRRLELFTLLLSLSGLAATGVFILRPMADRIGATIASLSQLNGRLADNEQRIRAIHNTVADGIITIDHRGTVQSINAAALRLFGYDEDEVVGRNVSVLMPDDVRKEHDRSIESYLRTGNARIIGIGREVLGRRNGGSLFPLELAVNEMQIGGELMFTGVMRDLSDRKQAEQQVREANRLLSLAEEVGRLGHWYVDLDKETVYWSPEVYRIHGRDPATFRPDLDAAIEAYHPDDRTRVRQFVADAADRQGAFSAELRLLRPDGELRHVQSIGRCEVDEAGNVTGIFGVVQDITERKHAEAVRRRAEANLRNAIESITEGFVLFDEDDRLVMCNSVYRRFYPESMDLFVPGTPFEDIVRQSVRRGQFPEATGQEDAWIAARMRHHNDPKSTPLEQILADGRVLLVSDRKTQEGLTVGIRTDITRLKRQEQDLREKHAELTKVIVDLNASRGQLEQQAKDLSTLASELAGARQAAEAASMAKSRFLAMMSHELRTPLTGIMGTIELLLDADLEQEQSDLVRLLGKSANSLLGLLNDVLDFSKIEAGELHLESVEFRVADVVSDVVELFSTTASRKGVSLRSTLAIDRSLSVLGDPTRLRQVLFNLVGNALKFTQKGHVEIRVLPAERSGEGLTLSFEVEDTGIGIAPDVQARLFTAFGQADPSTNRRYGGTGLGLVICKRLVEAMGGGIGLRSEVGAGSVFRFHVGLAPGGASALPDADPAAAVRKAGRPDRAVAPCRLLLAEDNETNRVLTATLLRRHGHTVVEAGDGVEAVQAAQHEDFDLILMDMQMPEMDGPEATRRIRALPPPAGTTPIIALTADALPEHRQGYLTAGLNAILTKPVDWQKLSDTILAFAAPGNGTAAPSAPESKANGRPTAAADRMGAVFDESRLQALRTAVGDEALLHEMLRRIPAEAEACLTTIRDRIADDDLEGARRSAHRLKGVAANLGAIRIERLAQQIERRIASPPEVEAMLVDLESAVRATRATIA